VVLVRAPNWIGDAVLSLPALRDVRLSFPAARLEVLARGWVAPVYEAVSEVDAVRAAPGRGVREEAALARAAGADLALLFPNSFGTALAMALAGIPDRRGYATDRRRLLLTRAARVPDAVRGQSELYYYRAMLAGVGLRVSASPDATLVPLPSWVESGGRKLGDAGPWIGVNAGAAYGTAKRWVPERYAAAAERLARELGARVAVLGGPAERPLAEAIAAQIRTPSRVLAGETSLGELIGVLSRLRLLLTNDSGPMHLAAALGVPLVALFGPTDWRETAPRGRHQRLVREPVDCAPCKLRECPIDHRCMRRVSVERVADEARALLAESA
jgi:heptosyltransferase-2